MAIAPETQNPSDVFRTVDENFEEDSTAPEGFEGVTQHIPVIEIVDPKKEHPVGMIADMTISMCCPEGCDLGGGTILIGDADDQVIAEQTLTGFDEGEGLNTTGSFSVQIPKEPGDYTWTIVFYPPKSNTPGNDESIDANEAEGSVRAETQARLSEAPPADTEAQVLLHSIAQTEYCFRAVQHLTGMSVWREGFQPVPVGEDYLLSVGVHCLHGCSLLGQTVKVYYKGDLLGSAVMGEPVPPFESLFCARIPLTAPAEVGAYTLECRLEPEGLDLLHTSNTSKYTLTTNKQSQCRLELTALNKEDGTPFNRTLFYIRPKDGYLGFVQAGEDGKASIGVPWGDVLVEANPHEYCGVRADITIPEGQEVYELTVNIPLIPLPFD